MAVSCQLSSCFTQGSCHAPQVPAMLHTAKHAGTNAVAGSYTQNVRNLKEGWTERKRLFACCMKATAWVAVHAACSQTSIHLINWWCHGAAPSLTDGPLRGRKQHKEARRSVGHRHRDGRPSLPRRHRVRWDESMPPPARQPMHGPETKRVISGGAPAARCRMRDARHGRRRRRRGRAAPRAGGSRHLALATVCSVLA